MKTILFILTFFSLNNIFSQNSSDYKIVSLMAGGGYNFEIMGSASPSFADSLFSHFSVKKRKGYIWKFKNVRIAGIDKPLTFQVHQGLAGVAPCKGNPICQSGGYFHTFVSEKYKQKLLANKKSNETDCLIIYLKRGRNHVVKTEEEAKLVYAYLLSIYKSKA